MENKEIIDYLKETFRKFESVIKLKDKNGIIIDASIHRFKYTLELLLKTLKKLLKYEKIESDTPKDILKKAYALNWISNEKIWLSMLDDRNLTLHAYDENISIEIYKRLPIYCQEMNKNLEFLKSKYY